MHKLPHSLVALALVGACLVASVALANADILKSDRRLAFELEQQRLQAERTQHLAEWYRPWWSIVAYSGLVMGVGGLGLWAYNWHADKAAQRRRIAPDAQGRFPIPDPTQFRADVAAQVAALMVHGQMQAPREAARTHQEGAPTRPVATMGAAPASVLSLRQVPPHLHALAAEPATPALPTLVRLRDVTAQIEPGAIALGIQQDGTLLQVPFGRVHHFLAMADTGAGKTGLMDTVITQLHPIIARAQRAGGYTFKLYAADYKRELVTTWGRSPLFQDGVLTDPREIADLLDDLVHGADGVLARYDRFTQTGERTGRIIKNVSDYATVTGTRVPVVVAFLDELNVLLTEAPKDIRQTLADNLKTLVQLGRGAGYNVFGGSQYLTSEILPRETTKQFINRALLGAYDGIAARVLFGSEPDKAIRAYADGTPGRGLIRTVGQAQPMPFQVLRCEEHDILDALRSGAPLRSTAGAPPLRTAPSSATERASTALEGHRAALRAAHDTVLPFRSPSAAAVVQQPAVAVSEQERVSILNAGAQPGENGQAPSRREICRRVFGTTGGQGFRKVQVVLDQGGLDHSAKIA